MACMCIFFVLSLAVKLLYRPYSVPQPLVSAHATAYAGLAGLFGAQSVLFAKSAAEVVKLTALGDNQVCVQI